MLNYIINRLLYLIPVIILVSIIVFSFMHMIPGDPVDSILGKDAPPEQREAMRVELGLDKPVVVQYITWAGNLVRGDFGRSLVYRKPVLELILQKMPATILLAVASIILATSFGMLIGIMVGSRQGSFIDMGGLLASLFWVSMPAFWLGILLVLCFAIYFPILPSMGYTSIFDNFFECLYYLALPTFTLGSVMMGGVTRVCRSEMIEQLNQDYVITAWAKGLPRRAIIYKHALKNALIPLITYIGLMMGYLMGGAVVVETIYSWPGVGRLIVTAIFQRDYPMVQGIVLLLALIFILVNLFVDISYTFLNPQIRPGVKK